MAEWTCRCGAKNEDGHRYCEGCGSENPTPANRQQRGRTIAPPNVPETHAPAKLPVYREPTPEEDAEIREQITRVRALLGITRPIDRPARPGLELPPIDPALRADPHAGLRRTQPEEG